MKTASEMKALTTATLNARINKAEKDTAEWLEDVVMGIIETAAAKGENAVEIVAPKRGMRDVGMVLLRAEGYVCHVQGKTGMRVRWC